ncbi:cytochrome P450 [Colletotrichum godetiae]|uniref:Cytochrome P450 n=1 Tax=Colletotrichum godetiae TaxID=1209918 RepID=A0AAJ0ESV5_9PEZI|nr:cytochrome P450 [Colletotrichum godetiae]KAK1659914.1 cytochrome P450 [Colletotrichum godetiae]
MDCEFGREQLAAKTMHKMTREINMDALHAASTKRISEFAMEHLKDASLSSWLSIIVLLFTAYWLLLIGYRLTLHPYAKYPGPKVAAISELWLRGRWPWAVEKAFEKYGDVVRIAPNEIAIFGYKAIVDVLMPGKTNDAQAFLKTEELGALAGKHKGFAADTDPKIHRHVRKAMEPSFNMNAIKRWQEPLFHKHYDRFVRKVEEACRNGPINLTEWNEWLSMDLAGDLTFGHDYGNIANGEAGEFLETFSKLSFWGTVNQVFARFPLLYPFVLLALSPSLATVAPKLQHINSRYIDDRTRTSDSLEHEDFMSSLIRDGEEPPGVDFLVAQSMNVVIGNAEATSNMFTVSVHFLGMHRDKLEKLKTDIRGRFASYEEIKSDNVQNITWLNAVINEGLRLATQGTSGLPRISPGGFVDGHYIPKGYRVQTSFWAVFHSKRYFAEPREFHPERWLPKDHPDYDKTFENDKLSVFQPFSIGTRGCIGRKTGLLQAQLMISKMVWALDWEHMNQHEMDWEWNLRRYAMNQLPQVVVRFRKRST